MLINYSNTIDPLLKNLRIKILEESLIQKESLVLDVCCGTGDQSFYYAQKSDYVFGVDLDFHMIDLAKKRKQQTKHNNPNFIISDASNLPFQDDYFDLVSICLALHEKNQELINKIISEMKRVVKKGGTIMIIDYNVPLPRNLLALFIRTIEFMAGKDHFNCFSKYIQLGGIDKVLKQNNLEAKENLFLMNRIIKLVKIIN